MRLTKLLALVNRNVIETTGKKPIHSGFSALTRSDNFEEIKQFVREITHNRLIKMCIKDNK